MTTPRERDGSVQGNLRIGEAGSESSVSVYDSEDEDHLQNGAPDHHADVAQANMDDTMRHGDHHYHEHVEQDVHGLQCEEDQVQARLQQQLEAMGVCEGHATDTYGNAEDPPAPAPTTIQLLEFLGAHPWWRWQKMTILCLSLPMQAAPARAKI